MTMPLAIPADAIPGALAARAVVIAGILAAA